MSDAPDAPPGTPDAAKARLQAALEDRYRIETQLGEGGMATVYLAEDLKHGRRVAIKVLKPELAAVIGGERFLAEIKTTANLQHPHILPLFDSGAADGFLYYVMPYVEGESLRDRLNREKQLPIDEAVGLAEDVASALHYAHERDVIHRDIKPENILLHAGQPVVADFGIALAISAAGGGRMTETGLSLGTPHYMSPEQATADRDLSARSDVYSLGCVLYEMLAGQPPHTGPSAQAVLVRILTEDPRELTDLRRTVPRHVAAVVSRAIEKLPADRFESAQAFLDALGDESFRYERAESAGPRPASARVPAPAAASRRAAAGGRLPWVFAASVAALAAWGWLRPDAPLQVTRSELNLPGAELTSSAFFRRFDVSPDGQSIVYAGTESGSLYLRGLDRLASVELPGTDSVLAPVFSPDGDAVLFRVPSGALKTVSLKGAPPLTIADGPTFPGVDWGDNGYVYFSRAGGLFRVLASGGEVEPILADSTVGGFGLIFPASLPGGRGLLYTSGGGDIQNSTIEVLDFESGEHKPLVQGVAGQYASTGHLVFANAEGTLLAAPFDLKTLEVGPATPILEGVSLRVAGHPEFAISDAGHLVYHAGGQINTSDDELISVIARDGTVTQLAPTRLVGDFEAVDVSPDGRYLAIMVQAANTGGDLWIYDQLQESFTPLTSTPGEREDLPIWSPDGRYLYYLVLAGGDGNAVYRIRSDASSPRELVLTAEVDLEDIDMSADGRFMVFKAQNPTGNNDDIWYADLEGDSVARPFLSTPFDEEGVGISPDGRWIAYESNESGRDQVYVRPFPAGGARIPISLDGGRDPVWANSGTELFYMNGEREVEVARLEVGETVAVAGREVLFFVGGYEWGSGEIQHAIAPDDQSFFFIGDRLRKAEEDPGELILVLNWYEELKERVGR